MPLLYDPDHIAADVRQARRAAQAHRVGQLGTQLFHIGSHAVGTAAVHSCHKGAGNQHAVRAQVMKTIRNLRDAGISIVSITHYMEEAAQADRILVMSRGRIVMEGTPEQVFSQTRRLHGYHLDVPQATELRDELAAAGLPMPENIITPEECAKAIFDLLK